MFSASFYFVNGLHYHVKQLDIKIVVNYLLVVNTKSWASTIEKILNNLADL